ncbi:hypothetical protein I317_01975 [Kwoniella heveanensis CBS 569]|nr:hypothetical protein I317_01975 [Kwoniella heveanensis CBS 569]
MTSITSTTITSSQAAEVIHSIQSSKTKLIRVVKYLLHELRTTRAASSPTTTRTQSSSDDAWTGVPVETLVSLTATINLAGKRKRKRSITDIGGIPISVIMSAPAPAPSSSSVSRPDANLDRSSGVNDTRHPYDVHPKQQQSTDNIVQLEPAGGKMNTLRPIKGLNLRGWQGRWRGDGNAEDRGPSGNQNQSLAAQSTGGRNSARSSGSFSSTATDDSEMGSGPEAGAGGGAEAGAGAGAMFEFAYAPGYGHHKLLDPISVNDSRHGIRLNQYHSSSEDFVLNDSESDDEDDVILIFDEKCRI